MEVEQQNTRGGNAQVGHGRGTKGRRGWGIRGGLAKIKDNMNKPYGNLLLLLDNLKT